MQLSLFLSEPLVFSSESEEKEYKALLAQACQLYLEQREKALEAFSRMEQRWPENPEVLAWLGAIHKDLGNLDLAIEYKEHAVRVSPKSEFNSKSLFLALEKAGVAHQDLTYWDRALAEAQRFLFTTGKASVAYGYIIKEMNGELTDEEHAKHLENIEKRIAHLEKPYVPEITRSAEEIARN